MNHEVGWTKRRNDQSLLNIRRVLIFIALFVLAALLFTPRDRGSPYEFIFIEFGKVDYGQLVLNVGFAAILGFIISQIPITALRIICLGVAGATVLSLAFSILQKKAVDRATSDEKMALELIRAGRKGEAKQYFLNAAANWRMALYLNHEQHARNNAQSIKDAFDDLADAKPPSDFQPNHPDTSDFNPATAVETKSFDPDEYLREKKEAFSERARASWENDPIVPEGGPRKKVRRAIPANPSPSPTLRD